MNNPSKEQLVDQDALQEPSDHEPFETSSEADTPSISNSDNNPEFEKLQARIKDLMAQQQEHRSDRADMAEEKRDCNKTRYFNVITKNNGVRIVEGVTLADTIDKFYQNLSTNLAEMERLKLQTLNQKIHRSYYSHWRVTANLLMRQLVILKTRKKRFGIKP
jgi:hypothetical protein